MLATLLLVAALGVPFEDVEHRFHLDVPKTWQFTPQPGDAFGATFHRDQDGVFANATIRVMPFSAPVTLEGFANRVAAASDNEPGFRLLTREEGHIAGAPSIRRRYLTLVNADPRLPKLVEQQVVLVGQTGFVIHGEALAEAFPLFEADILHMAATFAAGPIAGRGRVPAVPLRRSQLVGTWHAPGHSLVLSPGGAISLDGQHGTFHLEAATLVARLGKTTRVFQFEVTPQGLTLHGEPFANGQLFVRPQGHPPGARPKPARKRGGTDA